MHYWRYYCYNIYSRSRFAVAAVVVHFYFSIKFDFKNSDKTQPFESFARCKMFQVNFVKWHLFVCHSLISISLGNRVEYKDVDLYIYIFRRFVSVCQATSNHVFIPAIFISIIIIIIVKIYDSHRFFIDSLRRRTLFCDNIEFVSVFTIQCNLNCCRRENIDQQSLLTITPIVWIQFCPHTHILHQLLKKWSTICFVSFLFHCQWTS